MVETIEEADFVENVNTDSINKDKNAQTARELTEKNRIYHW